MPSLTQTGKYVLGMVPKIINQTGGFIMDPEDYEFYEEWLDRDDDEQDISLEDYNEMRCIEEYGDDNSDYYDEDDDSDDRYYD